MFSVYFVTYVSGLNPRLALTKPLNFVDAFSAALTDECGGL